MNTAMHRAALPDDDPAQLADPAVVAEAIAHLAGGAVDPGQARLEASSVLAATGAGTAG